MPGAMQFRPWRSGGHELRWDALDLTWMLQSHLGCPLSLKTANMGNTGLEGRDNEGTPS